MDLGLEGKVAVVTGGTRGIGRAIAQTLAREGARVVVGARGEGGIGEIRTQVAAAVVCDVMTREGVETLGAAADELGGADILVNNVGGSGARHFDAADEDDFRLTFEKNFWPALRMSRRLIPSMKSRGGGSIVMIASVWGREAGGAPAYNTAKAAEISLAKAMARDLAKDGIRVNTVAPGSILFPGGGWERRQKQDPAQIADMIARELPFGRFGRPDEVAEVVAFLVSGRASWMTGSCVVVDGGQGHAF